MSVASVTPSITGGCLSERMHSSTYFMYVLLLQAVIYPICTSWSLGKGWLYAIGFHDAAGAGYIHMVGGLSGLVGTIVLGPRFGIYDT